MKRQEKKEKKQGGRKKRSPQVEMVVMIEIEVNKVTELFLRLTRVIATLMVTFVQCAVLMMMESGCSVTGVTHGFTMTVLIYNMMQVLILLNGFVVGVRCVCLSLVKKVHEITKNQGFDYY